MGDQHRHPPGGQLGEPEEHLVLRPRVQRGGRLVQDQQLRVPHVGPGQRHLLPLAARRARRRPRTAGPASGRTGRPAAAATESARLRCGGGLDRAARPRARSMLPTAMFSRSTKVVAHEVLEDDADVPPEALDVVLAEVHAVEQDPALGRVVEPGQQLDQRGLARAVLAHQREPLARRAARSRVRAPPSCSEPGIAEPHALEHEARSGSAPAPAAPPGLRRMPGSSSRKREQVVQVEALLVHLRQREQHPLDQVPALPERAGQEGEHADGEQPGRRRGGR